VIFSDEDLIGNNDADTIGDFLWNTDNALFTINASGDTFGFGDLQFNASTGIWSLGGTDILMAANGAMTVNSAQNATDFTVMTPNYTEAFLIDGIPEQIHLFNDEFNLSPFGGPFTNHDEFRIGDADTPGMNTTSNGGGESFSTVYPDLAPGIDSGWQYPTDAPAVNDILKVEAIIGNVAELEYSDLLDGLQISGSGTVTNDGTINGSGVLDATNMTLVGIEKFTDSLMTDETVSLGSEIDMGSDIAADAGTIVRYGVWVTLWTADGPPDTLTVRLYINNVEVDSFTNSDQAAGFIDSGAVSEAFSADDYLQVKVELTGVGLPGDTIDVLGWLAEQ
jgi:hypothetical protein